MSAVEKVKAAAAGLGPDEQYELFCWWVKSDSFRQRQFAALKHDIDIGIEQLESGHYQAYDDSNVIQLTEEVGQSGRERLAQGRTKPQA